MGALPKRKHSTARKGKRRSEKKANRPTVVKCKNCGESRRPHRACTSCGFYSS